MLASQKGLLKMSKMLIELGSDKEEKDKFGKTALTLAGRRRDYVYFLRIARNLTYLIFL